MKKALIVIILMIMMLAGCSNSEQIEGDVIPYEELGEELYGIEYFDHYIYTNKYEIKNGLLYVSSYYKIYHAILVDREVDYDTATFTQVNRGKIISQFVIERIK